MNKFMTAIATLLMFLAAPTIAQNEVGLMSPVKETGLRVSLLNGNELYAWCQAAQDTFKLDPDGNNSVRFQFRPGSNPTDLVAAASCWAYIQGIVDSTPVGNEFTPGENVRLSQYADVVFEYLKNHPESRDKRAASLVQDALCRAFHK